MMGTDKVKALDRMMRLCSMGEQCRKDICGKLEKCGLEERDIQEMLEKLIAGGYIDEKRYAGAFVHDKSELQGWGAAKIRMALQRKGIQNEDIVEALSHIDGDSAGKKLRQMMQAKWEALEKETDPLKKQAKLFRFAAGRGYDYSQIKKIYDTFRTA